MPQLLFRRYKLLPHNDDIWGTSNLLRIALHTIPLMEIYTYP